MCLRQELCSCPEDENTQYGVSVKWNSYFCLKCRAWLAAGCDDVKCMYCLLRPKYVPLTDAFSVRKRDEFGYTRRQQNKLAENYRESMRRARNGAEIQAMRALLKIQKERDSNDRKNGS